MTDFEPFLALAVLVACIALFIWGAVKHAPKSEPDPDPDPAREDAEARYRRHQE